LTSDKESPVIVLPQAQANDVARRRAPLLTALTAACLFTALPSALPAAQAAAHTPSAAAASAAARALRALLDAEWRWTLREFPEMASSLGETAGAERWTDHSPAAFAARDAHARALLARLKTIPRTPLQGEDRISYDVMREQAERQVEAQQFPALRTRVLAAVEGPHLGLGEVLQEMPMRGEPDARRVLARLAAWPARVAQDIALLREGRRLGWVTHQASLAEVPAQIDALLNTPLRDSAAFEPFRRLLAAGPEVPLDGAQREALAAQGEAAVRAHVWPALRSLHQLVVDELLPASPVSGALSERPDGQAIYRHLVAAQTTTTLSVQAIHDTGLREVARLREAMEGVRRETGFEGDFNAFVHHLNTAPRFFHPDAATLLAGYRDIAKRVDPALPRLFAELPRMPYGIRPIPAYQGAGTAEFYSGGAADGSRPGWFNANVAALSARPTWEMEALFLHEAVPGHHLQTARAMEIQGLPMFRRTGWYVAYGEGWALYAEGLGSSLGLYQDPYARYGQLRMEIWRAARLVVDTGIHSLGWSRDQAIDWMAERTGMDRATVTAEVDRYYAWPGQALGYKIGQLKLLALRERAQQALGPAFDIRAFHQTVLDHGGLPLNVLEQVVADWLAASTAHPPAARRVR